MLRISKLTDYAIVILGQMASRSGDTHTASGLAESTGVAIPTVSKVLKMLAKRDIVRSTRGARGGYSLSNTPEQTTVAVVINALEGPIALTECEGERGGCEQSGSCHARGSWDVINRAVRTALDSVTLADMIRSASPVNQEVNIPVSGIQKYVKSTQRGA